MTEQTLACDMHRETVPGGLLSATVTPLASIFGSGFLVIAAILSAAVIGESPQAFHAVAFGLIVGGIFVSSRPR